MADKCPTCGKRVYAMEQIVVEGVKYHKTGCFKCSVCNKTLSPGNYSSLEKTLFCKPHFISTFKLKGNYSESFGREDPKKKWLEKEEGGAAAPAAEPAKPAISLHGLTMEEFDEAQALFRKYDADSNSFLDLAELKNLMTDLFEKKKVEKNLTDEKLQKTFESIDANHDGQISETEFFSAFNGLMLSVEQSHE